MDTLYRLQGTEFEWDNDKASSNIVKHGVSFPEAAEVFFDPFFVSGDASANDEARDYVIGASRLTRTLFVVSVERGKRTRIISARHATRAEKNLYENER